MKIKTITIGIILSLMLLILPATASDQCLSIYGNANKDNTINMMDVTYTELIILEYEDITKYADAKYDNNIDILDVTQIELVILGKEKKLTFVDSADRIVTIEMPIERVAIGHPGDAEAVRLLGAWDRVVGRDYYTTDEILFPGGTQPARMFREKPLPDRL